jgi:hypothetical protein
LFSIASEDWSAALTRELSDVQRAERHRSLGELGVRTERAEFAAAGHLFSAQLPVRALEALAPILRRDADRVEALAQSTMSATQTSEVLVSALTQAVALGRPPRELADIRRWACTLSVGSDDAYYHRAGPEFLAVLRRDSGLEDWLELASVEDAGQRITLALQRAVERHAATPEELRVYEVQDAIKFLVQFVVISIVIGTRTLDARLSSSLPDLLEPFAVLSPVIDAIHQNALATRECAVFAHYHQARQRWLQVYERLGSVPPDNLSYIAQIRSAILFGLGTLEAARGLPSAAARADLLDHDPMQMVNAMYLRRVMRMQMGDFDGAERFRRKAELLAVQVNARQMFTSMLQLELAAYGTARDLTGVREIAERVTALAKHAPGWLTYQRIAEGYLGFLRGDLTAARHSLEAALSLCWPGDHEPPRSVGAMPLTAALYVEILIGLDAYTDAKDFAQRALAECARADIRTTDELERGLALAEAKLGDTAGAVVRLDAVIERQRVQGVSGLLLGANYEARARIAIWAGDNVALEEYGKLAAREYRHGRGSPLGARYERLMSEARNAGAQVLPELSEFETSMLGSTSLGTRASAATLVSFAMRGANTAEERASAAARLIAEVSAARTVHLYLVQADGSVRWAASQSEQPQGAAELAQAQQCLARALDDDFGSTQIVSEVDSTLTHTSGMWSDPSGLGHGAQLLTVSGKSASRHVAVVLAIAPRSPAQSQSILSALAEHLLKLGDTEGLAV